MLLNFCVELILVMRREYAHEKFLYYSDIHSVRAFYHDKKHFRTVMYALWTLEQLVTMTAAGLSLKFGEMESGFCTFVTGPLISLPFWSVHCLLPSPADCKIR